MAERLPLPLLSHDGGHAGEPRGEAGTTGPGMSVLLTKQIQQGLMKLQWIPRIKTTRGLGQSGLNYKVWGALNFET